MKLVRQSRDLRRWPHFDESIGFGQGRAQQFCHASSAGFGKARRGKQQLGLGNEAAKSLQVCLIWHDLELNCN